MAVQRKRSGSVVSRSGGGPVVSGSRRAGGRIIGEVLSGGRNTSGVVAKRRAAPRPTRDSARHSLRPTAKSTTLKHDDYSDFGFDELDEWDDEDIEIQEAPAYTSRYGGVATQLPQTGAGTVSEWYQVAVVLGAIFRRIFIIAMFYAVFFMAGLQYKFDFLRVGLLPLALAVWCGIKAGAAIKREHQQGMSTGAAFVCTLCGSLLIGAGLYAVGHFIGFYPTFILTDQLDLPYTVHQYVNTIDMGLSRLFATFRLATYAVVPLSGILLGWMFSRR